MIDEILPSKVIAIESSIDSSVNALFPEERKLIERAVAKRREEFSAGRACAHRALKVLGVAPQPIAAGQHGEPCWPPGVVGSITHCDGYRASAVAMVADYLAVGIDAEPHLPLPDGLLTDIAGAEEIASITRLTEVSPGIHWQRLLFSAKEAVYKAWFPLTKVQLGFHDAILSFSLPNRSFTAHVIGRPPRSNEGFSVPGRWATSTEHIVTAVAIPRTDL